MIGRLLYSDYSISNIVHVTLSAVVSMGWFDGGGTMIDG